MKASDSNLDSCGAQLASYIDSARELISLHSDQQHDAAIRIALEPPNNLMHRDFLVSLVVSFDLKIDALAQDVPRLRIKREAVATAGRSESDGLRGPRPRSASAAA